MSRNTPQLLVCDSKNKIYPLPHLEATGMKGGHFFRLAPDDLKRMPKGSQLFALPDRFPIGYDPSTESFNALSHNPASQKRDGYFAVAAFLSPGNTATYSSSYREHENPKILPLYSYAAAAFYKSEIYTASIMVDSDLRHDARFIDICVVREKARILRKILKGNRLVRHLEDCALLNGCRGAQNFFLSKYEGPLPSSPSCNCRCIGCISLQGDKDIPPAQPRIKFTPTPEEISEIALYHISNVKNAVVSFGQGCDGEPLVEWKVIEKAIAMIRSKTRYGSINMNTNASKPDALSRLFDAGLESIRVSLNSARPEHYTKYYAPKGYQFRDVMASIGTAKRKGAHVSINYLTMPGFTDLKDEFEALKGLIGKYCIDMIQWRNMNYDPLWYFRRIKYFPEPADMLGVSMIMKSLRSSYPKLKMGYFNPMRSKYGGIR